MQLNPFKCRYAAWRLACLSSTALNSDLINACRVGLLDLASHCGQYEGLVITCSPFLDEINEAVNSLCSSPCPEPFHLEDIAFQLLEAIAAVMREVVLRRFFEVPRKAQSMVLSYFERSGQWAHEERTVLMDYYYARVPIAVMHSLSPRAGET